MVLWGDPSQPGLPMSLGGSKSKFGNCSAVGGVEQNTSNSQRCNGLVTAAMATALKSCHLATNTTDAGEIDPCWTCSPLPRFQVVVSRTPPISIRFGRGLLRSALRCWWWQGPLENQVSRLSRIPPDLCWDRRSGAADCVLRSAQDTMSVIDAC
jgi:hypothetical protein